MSIVPPNSNPVTMSPTQGQKSKEDQNGTETTEETNTSRISMIQYAQLKPRYQITVPASIRKELNAGVGSCFSFMIVGQRQCLLTLQKTDLEMNCARMFTEESG